jgi:hypothetical protein
LQVWTQGDEPLVDKFEHQVRGIEHREMRIESDRISLNTDLERATANRSSDLGRGSRQTTVGSSGAKYHHRRATGGK